MLWWLGGVLGLFAVCGIAVLALSIRLRPGPIQPVLDVPTVAQRYIFIVGTLSGFSVASAVFLAGFIERTGSPALLTVIGMFLIAFLTFIGTAMIYGTIPAAPVGDAAPDRFLGWQRTIYVMANCGYFVGLSLSWFALRPFLIAIKLDFLADIFTWLLLVAGLAGATRISLHLHGLTLHNLHACFNMPLIGFGLAAVYRFLLVPAFPILWPPMHAPLVFAVIGFLLTGTAFLLDTVMLALGPEHRVSRWLTAPGSRWLLVYCQLTIASSGLLWAAVVAP